MTSDRTFLVIVAFFIETIVLAVNFTGTRKWCSQPAEAEEDLTLDTSLKTCTEKQNQLLNHNRQYL